MRCQGPKFFYEFKKRRTHMLKEKEPIKKEPFHVIFMRKLEEERLEKEKEKIKAEKRRLKEE
jgi:DNA-dependent RNA polymerase auxiliary subunit epsilon